MCCIQLLFIVMMLISFLRAEVGVEVGVRSLLTARDILGSASCTSISGLSSTIRLISTKEATTRYLWHAHHARSA